MPTVESLVDRARVYIADDHDDTAGFIAAERWVDIFNAEYSAQYADWVRHGLLTPAATDATFTSHTTTVAGVLATVGVAEDLGGGQIRVLQPAQSSHGRQPFWGYTEGTPVHWQAHGAVDSMTYVLEPRVTGNYFVRYIPVPTLPTAISDSVSLPFGTDERLVLGIARRAKLKDGSASALLERLYLEAGAQLNFRAFGRVDGDGPRVRRKTAPLVRTFPVDPRLWRYSL